MKTVTGKIASTKPVSLSKAAKIISNFVVSDHESTPAVSAYLMRTSEAFNELVQLHKELKPDRKKKRSEDQAVDSAGGSAGSLKKKTKKRKSET